MNNLEKYLDQVIEQKPIVYEPPVEAPKPPPEEAPPVNVLASVRRRWYIVLAATVVLCALALPAIFLLVEPQHVVQGAVREAIRSSTARRKDRVRAPFVVRSKSFQTMMMRPMIAQAASGHIIQPPPVQSSETFSPNVFSGGVRP